MRWFDWVREVSCKMSDYLRKVDFFSEKFMKSLYAFIAGTNWVHIFTTSPIRLNVCKNEKTHSFEFRWRVGATSVIDRVWLLLYNIWLNTNSLMIFKFVLKTTSFLNIFFEWIEFLIKNQRIPSTNSSDTNLVFWYKKQLAEASAVCKDYPVEC